MLGELRRFVSQACLQGLYSILEVGEFGRGRRWISGTGAGKGRAWERLWNGASGHRHWQKERRRRDTASWRKGSEG
jgi:hypothetical protein